MKRTTYEIEEEWAVCCGGSLYAGKVGEKPKDWKVSADFWPKALGNDVRMAQLSGFSIEGSARHVLPLLKELVSLIELIDEDYRDELAPKEGS